MEYRYKLHPKAKCFQDSYFVIAVKNWNNIPLDNRNSDSLEKFKVMFKTPDSFLAWDLTKFITKA